MSGWTPEELGLLEGFQRDGRSIVVNMSRSKGKPDAHPRLWRWAEENGCAVRIDRRGAWGNPFEIPDDGDRAEVIRKYAAYYLPHKPGLQARLLELRGKILGCWCAPLQCHGDVLIEAAYAGAV